MKNSSSPQSGVALLMSLGILALLSILGIAYSTNMRLMERTSRDFVLEVQARYLAQGGIEYAIAELKKDARSNFVFSAVDTDDTIEPSSGDLPANTSVSVKIIDTARQININNANANLLATLPGIGTTIANNIITKRNEMPNDRFLTKQSVALASGIGEDVFNTIKDYITTDTYIDPNVQDNAGTSQQRSAININTVTDDDNKLLEKILDVVTDVGDATAGTVATALMNNTIESWQEFNTIIDNLSIDANAKDNIKSVFNPNRQKPDDNVPTEFCFHSGGTYEITATSTISRNTKTIAQKTITATLQIFGLWNQTTRGQFMEPDYGEHGWEGLGDPGWDDGEIGRVTWFDSCPVRSDQNWNQNPQNFERINGSLKLGFWDSFENQYNDEIEYSKLEWKTNQSQAAWGSSNIPSGWYTGGQLAIPEWSDVYLCSRTKWDFDNMLIIVYLNDVQEPTADWNEWEVPSFVFRYLDSSDGGGGDDSVQLTKYNTFVTPPVEYLHYRISLKSAWDGYPVEADQYAKEKLYRIHQIYETTTIYMNTNLSTLSFGAPIRSPIIYNVEIGGNRQNNKGRIKFWGGKAGVVVDNIRIISENGYYICEPFVTPNSEIVEWGTIWGTESLPKRSDGNYDAGLNAESTNKIGFQTRTCIGQNWSNVDYSWYPHAPNGDGGDFTVDNMKQPEAGSNIERVNGAGNTLQYRAVFVTDGSYEHTPVLEDIWITYLPKTKILYWKEK